MDGSYLINLVKTNDENVHEMLYDDLHRCKLLGINKYNMHPGINIIDDLEQAILNVATAINNAQIKFIDVTFLLETMPGTGRDIGNSFDELARIIDLVENKNKIGVTFDTCNMFVAGYDINTKQGFDRVIDEFDDIVGLQYLQMAHLVDSREEFMSGKQWRESLGKGRMGMKCFESIMNHDAFNDIPLILHTPDEGLFREKIATLRSLELK